jgi:hypothetical protein
LTVQSIGEFGTGFTHDSITLPRQSQNWHECDGHSLLLRQICAAAMAPLMTGHTLPGWQKTLALDFVVLVERMQQMFPAGQSAASSQAMGVPVHAALAAWQLSVSESQQTSAGTPHWASPQLTVPGVQRLPPSGTTHSVPLSPAAASLAGPPS